MVEPSGDNASLASKADELNRLGHVGTLSEQYAVGPVASRGGVNRKRVILIGRHSGDKLATLAECARRDRRTASSSQAAHFDPARRTEDFRGTGIVRRDSKIAVV